MISLYHIIPNLRNFYADRIKVREKEGFLKNINSDLKEELLNIITHKNVKMSDILYVIDNMSANELINIANCYSLNIKNLCSQLPNTYTTDINETFLKIPEYRFYIKIR